MQQQEKEIFEGYEIKTWNFSPRIYKILVASAVLNLFAVMVLGQTNLLTRKGCESPFVSSVCQVLDAVYAGSALLGTDSEFVSKEYQKTELDDADITYIDVSRSAPPLTYPEGYFALANPEQFAMQPDGTMTPNGNFGDPSFGGFPTYQTPPPAAGGSDLLASQPTLPPVNNNPIIGDLPSSINSAPPVYYPKPPRGRKFPKNVTPKASKIPDDSPKDLPDLGDETAENKDGKAEKKPEAAKEEIKSEKVAGVEINKKPFEDLGDALNDKLEKKEIDLTKPFFVVLDATINDDGKFDPKKSKFVRADGDKEMSDMAKLALEAVGNSGILGHLKGVGINKVNITLVQDNEKISAIILSDQKTPEKARTSASGFNTLLSGLILLDNNGLTKLDANSKTLVNNSKVTSDGKNFVLNFAIPKQMGQELIDQSLKQRAEKKNNPASNGSGVSLNANQNTSK
ncbi:MAG TPA: hypothetical protein VNI84_15560 [Pyrinomonadaceae bacterium]|nr:hypothetical protein [Pyrinomonadaceae bacterium]